MKNILLSLVGLSLLLLSACGAGAAATPIVSDPATAVFVPPSETPLPIPTATAIPSTETPAPTDTAIPPTESASAEVSFANDVMPILSNYCIECHGVEQVKEGLNLTSYDQLMAGSFNGAVIVPGSADESLLAELISAGKMPKRGEKPNAEMIQIIINWINAGALNN